MCFFCPLFLLFGVCWPCRVWRFVFFHETRDVFSHDFFKYFLSHFFFLLPPDSNDTSVGPFVIISQVPEDLCSSHPQSTFCQVGKFDRSFLRLTDCFPCVDLLLSPSRWRFGDPTFQLQQFHAVALCDFYSFIVIFFNLFHGNL